MATRFYFQSTTPASERITVATNNGGEWEHVDTSNVFIMHAGPAELTALNSRQYSPDAADHIVDADALNALFVSRETLAAQTISAQTIKWQFQCLESNAGNNISLTIKIFVCDRDGSTIKETLLAIRRDGTEMATTLTNRGDSALSTAANVEDGDRICVELGCGGLPVATGGVQGHNCQIRFGEDASGGDLPEDDTDTTTTKRGWLEFPNTLTFLTSLPFPNKHRPLTYAPFVDYSDWTQQVGQ